MYVQQLESFIQVARCGSFSKAANALYITPSAIIQQINNLEKNLRVTLFHRTKKGVTLTPAGDYLLSEVQDLLRKTRQIENGLTRFRSEEQHMLRVGTTFLHKCRALYPIWKAFKIKHPEYNIAMSVLDTQCDVDVIESIRDGQSWQKYMDFLPLCQFPLVCAVPEDHPLAKKDRLTIEDLQQTPIVTIARGLSHTMNQLTDELIRKGVTVMEVPSYDISVFSFCQTNGYLLQIPYVWKDLYQGMKPIPCEWDYSLSYGFFYRRNASPSVLSFIQFVRHWIKDKPIASYIESGSSRS